MSISFPYKTKLIEEGIIPDPTITLSVKTLYGIRNLKFLVDSGADTTVVPVDLASDFGFKPSGAVKEYVKGVGNVKVGSYPSKIEVSLGDKFYKVRCVFIESKVMPLLGRLDIWDKFTVIFDNMKKEVVFRSI